MIDIFTVSQSPAHLTFDDVLLRPGYVDFVRSEIDLRGRFTKNIELELPLVSSPMDTVTESKLAKELSRLGGIGVIHRNLSIEDQASEVKKVKDEGLRVAAAVGTKRGFEQRVGALVRAGVDAVVIDSAHGFSRWVIEAVELIKRKFRVEVMAGNVATYEGAKALIEAGADGLRVGMGPGAICTTRIVSGMGVPQLTALGETIKAGREAGVPVCADGGIKYSGDMVKALAMGAESVMMGSYFASAEESPGEVVVLNKDELPVSFQHLVKPGKREYKFKSYRGMGSIGAMEKGKKIQSEEEYHGKDFKSKVTMVAEGVEALVPIKGTVAEVVAQAEGGIRSGMYYVGARNLGELVEKAQFLRITQASLTESHVHEVIVTNAGENY